MTSKTDYKAIAKAIRESDIDIAPLDNPFGFSLDKVLLINRLCKIFIADNDLFDTAKFQDACLMPRLRVSHVIPATNKEAELWR